MTISLVVITDFSNPDNLTRCLKSVDGLVNEVVIVYQGDSSEKFSELGRMASLAVKVRYKGNADPDRDYAYSLASGDWILALDDDEYLEEETKAFVSRIVYSAAEVVWFSFRNLVDGVNIKEILGDDPHPRLWRKKQDLIRWPAQAHTFPQINSEKQYFTQLHVTHDRKYDDLLRRHEIRGKFIDPQAQEREKQFLEAVKRKLGK